MTDGKHSQTGADEMISDGKNAGLVLSDIVLRLQGKVLLKIDTRIEPGEIVTLMGPSGSGKSSLLAYLCGVLTSEMSVSGQAVLNGRNLADLPPPDRHVGILFQDDLLFPHLSVGGNLAFALPRHIRGKARRNECVTAALRTAGLEGYGDRDPATLSGGQRARVAVMRVLLSEPSALLLDEPFSKLDATLRDQFRRFVFDQVRSKSLPTLMVTHDPEDANAASAAGGRVIELSVQVNRL